MTQSKHDQMLELVETLRTVEADERCNDSLCYEAADALTALLEENATLRTEKHADAEAIGMLREALQDIATDGSGWPVEVARDALKGDTP